MTLKELIEDCGGTEPVSERFGCSYQNIHKMIKRGCLPDCDRRQKWRAEALAEMQKTGRLTPDEIRAIVKT